MSVYIDPAGMRAIGFGIRVAKAAFTLPATTTGGLFTVSGGRIILTSIIGEVTTQVQAQANAINLVATPTTGTVNDLSATVESNGAIVGTLLGITGLAADAMVKSTGGGISNLRNPVVVAIGTIGLKTAATNTGATKWVMTYIPLDDAATVAAV